MKFYEFCKGILGTLVFMIGLPLTAGCLDFANLAQGGSDQHPATSQTIPPKPSEMQNPSLIYPGTYKSDRPTLVLKRLKNGEYNIALSEKSDGVHPVEDFGANGYQINNEIVFPVELSTGSVDDFEKEIVLKRSYYLLRQLSPKKVEWKAHIEPLTQNALSLFSYRGRSAEDNEGEYTRK